MADINSREAVEKLVNEFYNKVQMDEVLAPLFAHLNWPHHLPVMYNFWSSILLGDQTYEGNPFQKHVSLPVVSLHFERWLKLFHQTIRENFAGPKAEEAITRAQNIATLFQHKLGLIK